MAIFYPGIKVDAEIPASELLYTMTVYAMSAKAPSPSEPEVLLAMKQPKNVPADYRIIETVSALTPRAYCIEIQLYRKFSTPCLVMEYPIAPSLAEFTSSNSLDQFRPIKYRESNAKMTSTGNCITVSIPRKKRIFETPEYPAEKNDPNDPFRFETIKVELSVRLQGSTYPDQGATSLCGPAAYFYVLLKDRPDIYRQMVLDLWEVGETKFRNLSIKAGNAAKPSDFFIPKKDINGNKIYQKRINGIDWITMASLRDSSNDVLAYDSVTEQISAITAWWTMEEWFQKSGGRIYFTNVSLENKKLNDIVILNKFKQANPRAYIVNLIYAGGILENGSGSFIIKKTHWIVWNKSVNINSNPVNENSPKDSLISLDLFSWGNSSQFGQLKNSGVSLEQFYKNNFGGIVVNIL